MILRETLDVTIDQAIRHFERSNQHFELYQSTFGYPDAFRQFIEQLYGTIVVVSPDYVIFDHQYFYDLPDWATFFMERVIEENQDAFVTNRVCVTILRELKAEYHF